MRRVLIPALALLMLASACQKAQQPNGQSSSPEVKFPVTIQAANGAVTIPKRPTRIVSLSPTATEMLFAVGAGKQVIAADDFSNYPPEAPKTALSGFQPNVEAVTAYKPDLVVFQSDPGEFGSALKAVGIAAIMQPSAKTLDDSYKQIEQLGKATGNVQKAEDLVKDMKAQIKKLVASISKPDQPFTYYHELDQTYYSATSKTFIGQIYGLVGLKNIADEADTQGNGYPQLSAEYIIKADPSFIFLADTKCCGQSQESVAARPGWDKITAVKQTQVIELDDDIASRWGPRIVDFLETVAKAMKAPEPVKS